MFLNFSFKKAGNILLLAFSYFFSKWFRTPISLGKPIALSIEPTTSCNLRCPECPSGLRAFSRPTGMLSLELFKKVVDESAQHLAYLNLYFQGEPYLNPHFLDFVRYARQKRVYTSTSTNAHYLDEEQAKATVVSGLSRLIISIDGTTQATYESYRVGGKLDKVIEGTKRVVRWKKALKSKYPKLVFQFLVVKPNEHQIEEIKVLGEEIGVDEVSFKTAQIYDYEKGSPLIPDNPKYSRYRLQTNGTYAIKNPLKNQCWKMWHSCVMTWDGDIVPCCFDKDAKYKMGNIGEEPLSTIWESASYQAFRRRLLKGRSSIDICTNCTEGMSIYEKG